MGEGRVEGCEKGRIERDDEEIGLGLGLGVVLCG